LRKSIFGLFDAARRSACSTGRGIAFDLRLWFLCPLFGVHLSGTCTRGDTARSFFSEAASVRTPSIMVETGMLANKALLDSVHAHESPMTGGPYGASR